MSKSNKEDGRSSKIKEVGSSSRVAGWQEYVGSGGRGVRGGGGGLATSPPRRLNVLIPDERLLRGEPAKR